MAEETPTPGEQDGGQDEPGEGESELETQPADGAADAPESDAVLLDPAEVEEETEAEKGLASITAKLSALAEVAKAERLETVVALAALGPRINFLREREGKFRAGVESEIAACAKASGRFDGKAEAFNELATELERDDASGAVAGLKRLIAFERLAILHAAKKLVGDTPAHAEYLAVFLDEAANPELIIDEGRAGDLSFEKKQRAIRITGLEQAYQALIQTRGMLAVGKDPEVIEAKKKLDDAVFDQGACEREMMMLCQKIFTSRATIADLASSIMKAGTFAGSIRSRAKGVEDTSDSSAIDIARQALGANARLIEEAAGTRAELVRKEQSATELENTCTRLIGEQGRVLATLNAAKPLVAGAAKGGDLYEMIGRIGRDLKEYEDSVSEPINRSGTVVVKPDVHTILTVAGIAHIVDLNSMRTALVRAGERLQRMVDALSESIETANGEDPVQLGAVENVLAAAERVQRFIDEEWPELVAGDPSKIAAIGAAIKRRVKEVFGPLESLADFLRAGPDAWAKFQVRRATGGAEAATTRTEGAVAAEEEPRVAVTGDEAGAGGTAAPDADAGADSGTASTPDDGTGSVPTPRDPLPVVREGEIVKADDGGADDGGGDDSSTDVELNFSEGDLGPDSDSEPDETETSEEATAPEKGAVAEPDPSATPLVENELAGPGGEPAGGEEGTAAPRKPRKARRIEDK